MPSFFKSLGPVTVKQLSDAIECNIYNLNDNEKFTNFVGIENLEENSLSFLYDIHNKTKISLNIGTIICTSKTASKLNKNLKLIIVKNVQESIAIVSNLFYRNYNKSDLKNLPNFEIGKNCDISKNAFIDKDVTIGNNVIIKDGCKVSAGCIIGNGTTIDVNSVISHSIIGENVNIGRNTSIGQPGFGFYMNNSKNLKIFHSGSVIIQSNASIGSNCCIDRGSFSDTVIGENTFFDNLCHVAHNVVVGKNCAFAAMTGIAGSTKIGNNVMTGGQAGISGHLNLGNNIQIAAKSGVFHSLSDGQSVMGNPAINKYKFLKKYKKFYGK